MATVMIDIPDQLVPELTRALALRMRDTEDAAVAAVVMKVTTGQATTGAEKQLLARAFMRGAAKSALVDWRAQQAAQQARDIGLPWD